MYYHSTRNAEQHYTLAQAITAGLAPDGGLFVPDHFPKFDIAQFTPDLTYATFAELVLQPFFQGDVLAPSLPTFCLQAFNFPVPLTSINDNTLMLELFHGPTSSFKDFGARFLAECLTSLSKQQKTLIMVATSGDTGSAVASAFYLKPNTQVVILYPKDQISTRQKQQITCWDTNIIALEVEGTFDDCQRLVKASFQDKNRNAQWHISSANSINIGRLLPQVVFYAYASMQFYFQQKKSVGFIIPTGNLGNATSAYWAQQLGFPIREIALATNANVVIPDYLNTGEFHPRPSMMTLANAMDVGNPSNFERLHYLFPDFTDFKSHVSAISASNEDIQKMIVSVYHNYHKMICPHTATGFYARTSMSEEPWIIAATADPSKFDTIIEPLLHTAVPVAPALQTLLERKSVTQIIKPSLEAIASCIPAAWNA